MRAFDIIAVGELNVDLILRGVPSLPQMDKELFAQEMTLALGSSTAIFAANAAVIGAKVAFCGMIGDDSFGSLVEQSLQAKGVDTRYIVKQNEYATGATICLSYGNDRANVTYAGAMEHFSFKQVPEELFANGKHLHLSSIFMQPGLMKDLKRILETAKAAGMTTSMDTQFDPEEKWELDYKQILPLADIFLPNEQELTAITRTSTVDEAIEAIRPYIHTAVVKCGAAGNKMVREGKKDLWLDSYHNAQVVDAIGAGDSFNAGFLARFVQGDDLIRCQQYGAMTGAVNTTAAGGTAAFTTKEEVEHKGQQLGWQ